MVTVILLLAALTVYGLLEYRAHRFHLRSIPVRIHVNGTRGKSSITRLIAAGLRAGERRVVAKTTGTKPRIILEDGREIPIDVLGRPLKRRRPLPNARRIVQQPSAEGIAQDHAEAEHIVAR